MHSLHRVSRICHTAAAGTIQCRMSRRPSAPLGARILTHPDHIFQHNMWDHVQWSEEDKENARQKATANSCEQIPAEEQVKFDRGAFKYWDGFYKMHDNKFFKDRNWLCLEFPELLCGERARDQQGDADYPGGNGAFTILEVGCGAGNSVFPIIRSNRGTGTFLYCCDFSPRAIQIVKDHPDYDQTLCHAFVHDVCDAEADFPFPPSSLDVLLLVFVLSSINPQRMQGVVSHLSRFLKPGGIFLFRDYGRYDLSQLRFKQGHCLSENFYARGNGTCVYFFTKEEVHLLFSRAGLQHVQNLEDRRLQVNRRKKVVMRRVWMQSKYRKPD